MALSFCHVPAGVPASDPAPLVLGNLQPVMKKYKPPVSRLT